MHEGFFAFYILWVHKSSAQSDFGSGVSVQNGGRNCNGKWFVVRLTNFSDFSNPEKLKNQI